VADEWKERDGREGERFRKWLDEWSDSGGVGAPCPGALLRRASNGGPHLDAALLARRSLVCRDRRRAALGFYYSQWLEL